MTAVECLIVALLLSLSYNLTVDDAIYSETENVFFKRPKYVPEGVGRVLRIYVL